MTKAEFRGCTEIGDRGAPRTAYRRGGGPCWRHTWDRGPHGLGTTPHGHISHRHILLRPERMDSPQEWPPPPEPAARRAHRLANGPTFFVASDRDGADPPAVRGSPIDRPSPFSFLLQTLRDPPNPVATFGLSSG